MRTLFKQILLVFIAFIYSVTAESCNKNGTTQKEERHEGERKALKFSSFMELNQDADEMNSHASDYTRSSLKMMYGTLQEHGPAEGYKWPRYPRIRKMSDGSYILMWQTPSVEWKSTNNGLDVYYALSQDLNVWTAPSKLFASRDVKTVKGESDVRQYSNGNGIVLSNGDFLAVAEFRAMKTYKDINCKKDHGLVIKRSKDCGKTWSGEQVIYYGPSWEGHLMEPVPNEIHCYFAESRPWIRGSHSGTSLVISKDGGATWSPTPGSEPYRVMRKKWYSETDMAYFYTDQMPVGIQLNGSRQMAFAVECVAHAQISPTHYMSIVYSPEDGQWKYLQGDEEADCERLDNFVAGGGPYLVQFPSGETVVANSNVKDSKMHYMIGDAKAANFFGDFVSLPHKGSWGGMEVDSPHSVIFCRTSNEAVTSKEDLSTLMLARFALNHSIRASKRTATIDADNKEWKNTDDALFLGSKSPVQATLRCSQDADNLYFLIEVQDSNLSSSDYVTIMLSPDLENGKLGAKARRIRAGINGLKGTEQFSGGWNDKEMNVSARVAYDGTPDDNSDIDNGYLVEISVPRKSLEITGGNLLLNFAMFDKAVSFEDAIAVTSAADTKNWVYINKL